MCELEVYHVQAVSPGHQQSRQRGNVTLVQPQANHQDQQSTQLLCGRLLIVDDDMSDQQDRTKQWYCPMNINYNASYADASCRPECLRAIRAMYASGSSEVFHSTTEATLLVVEKKLMCKEGTARHHNCSN